ncbi:MAG: hypothetical protein M1445_11530 [Bacteroidetes bacterium]|nr:hypothetical protein [Bacteroidota bacterium]MCL6103580.1 hypothetical protein [Bacteroidota bacterium]
MEEKSMQIQITELNQKVDLLLEYVNGQRLKANQLEDLISDLSIVGKDVYDTTVEELNNRMVKIDPDQVKNIGLRLLSNVDNIAKALEIFESLSDLAKDAMPIVNEVIIDSTRKMNELDQKGYFNFFKEVGLIFDNIITHFSREEVHLLAENVVTILETVKTLTQPEMMNAVNNAIKVFGSINTTDVPEYSVWKLMREINQPEMKKTIGFMVTYMKSLSGNNLSNK